MTLEDVVDRKSQLHRDAFEFCLNGASNRTRDGECCEGCVDRGENWGLDAWWSRSSNGGVDRAAVDGACRAIHVIRQPRGEGATRFRRRNDGDRARVAARIWAGYSNK